MFLEEGYEKTYEWALRLIKEYPNCNMLIWQAAVMLDARRITDKCTNPENMISRLTHGMSWHCMMKMKKYSIMQQILYLDFIYVRRITPRQKNMKILFFPAIVYLILCFPQWLDWHYRENDIGYAKFLSGKVQAVVHTLEMGKYNEYSPMLDIVCAGKDVEGTYKVVKLLIDNVGTMYDFRKSGLYKHMKFRDIDEAILDSVKEKLLEGFRNEEEFGYMAGYEPWEKLIFTDKLFENCRLVKSIPFLKALR